MTSWIPSQFKITGDGGIPLGNRRSIDLLLLPQWPGSEPSSPSRIEGPTNTSTVPSPSRSAKAGARPSTIHTQTGCDLHHVSIRRKRGHCTGLVQIASAATRVPDPPEGQTGWSRSSPPSSSSSEGEPVSSGGSPDPPPSPPPEPSPPNSRPVSMISVSSLPSTLAFRNLHRLHHLRPGLPPPPPPGVSLLTTWTMATISGMLSLSTSHQDCHSGSKGTPRHHPRIGSLEGYDCRHAIPWNDTQNNLWCG